MKKTFLLFTLLLSFLMTAQTEPVIEWQKSLGGSGNDVAHSIQQTSDGGYIIAGRSNSNNGDVTGNHGDFDYWIVKLDSNRNIQWQKSLGGSGDDLARSVQQTTDGGYIVAGYSYSNDGDVTGNHGMGDSADFWVLKLDSNGNIQWQKSLGGNYSEHAYSVQQTTDGGYIIAGDSGSNDGDVIGNHGSSDFWIVKLDSNGNIQWQKSLGGSKLDFANAIRQTIDGGYIVAGFSQSSDGDVSENQGSYDYWIVKLDNNGNIQWQKPLGGSNNDGARAIQQTIDGGYIIAGRSNSTDGDVSGNYGDFDYWIVKLNSTGNIQWQKSLGGSGIDDAYAIQQTTDGGYIVGGYSNSNNGNVNGNHGDYDIWIVKLDNNGNIQWQKSLGGSGIESFYAIQQTTDGGYIVAGSSNSNNGDVSGNHGDFDCWIVKLSADGLATEETNFTKINVYPNPVKETLHFSEEVSNVKITDISGRTVKEISAKGKSVNVANLAKGIYLISAVTKSGEMVNKKMVKE